MAGQQERGGQEEKAGDRERDAEAGEAGQQAPQGPVYPHSLIWRSDNPHPALKTLRTYLGTVPPRRRDAGIWTPKWAHR